MILFFRYTFFFFILLWSTAARPNPNIDRLKNVKVKINKKIERYANYLKQTQKKEQTVLSKIEQLSYNIRLKERLISSNQKEIRRIQKSIKINQRNVAKLQKELKALKDDYARMIINSFKTTNSKNKLLFFLSSKDFFQLYKRISYMKQYSSSRRLKGIQIEQKTKKLDQTVLRLKKQQKAKKVLQKSFQEESSKLFSIKRSQKRLYGKLKINEKKYRAEIYKQEREAKSLDQQIEKLINLFIKQQKSATISLTRETALLASSFQNRKGRLPWPVKKGIISRHFGRQKHPVLNMVTVFCSGIEITAPKNSIAQSIFDGEVVSVQLLNDGKKTVYIRHGNYISVYSNLGSIYVKQGDPIKMTQPIGKVVYDSLQRKTILKFLIYKNNVRLNPEKWISDI